MSDMSQLTHLIIALGPTIAILPLSATGRAESRGEGVYKHPVCTHACSAAVRTADGAESSYNRAPSPPFWAHLGVA